MGRIRKIFLKVLSGQSDKNIKFEELCLLLEKLGFEMRINSSHHIFRKSGVTDKINLQKDGSEAKPYQVKQVRKVIIEYKMEIVDE